jgi:hypothetical protein
MIVTTAQLYQVAYGKFAVGACNINNTEECLGLFRDTDGRLVWTRVHREFFRDPSEQFYFRPPGETFVEEYANFIRTKNEKLDSAGNRMKSGRA